LHRLQVFYLLLALYGWWAWLHGGERRSAAAGLAFCIAGLRTWTATYRSPAVVLVAGGSLSRS
jgi:nicotinamide riboside transporter PnuC